jgi:DNA-binding response OmpR family regulator
MSDIKIMVVDDEARMRKLVRDYLAKSGYLVIEAEDGEDAYDKFVSTKDISLIVMDIMMPKMDGYETSREIRKISNVPIILLTAKSDEKDELKGYEQGVDEYITKPFSP